MPEKIITNDGVRILIDPITTSEAVSIGAWIDLGSRDEGESEHGFAHFIEHMLFKGTKRRSAYDIAAQIDRIGGEINGSTGKENTYFFVDAQAAYWKRSLEILLDMYCNSSFAIDEFEKEKLVILDEINMSIDDPEDFVSDLFAEALWGEHPLGLPVLGKRENVGSVSTDEIVTYYKNHYTKDSLIISIAGNVDATEVQQFVEQHLHSCNIKSSKVITNIERDKPVSKCSTSIENRDIMQVNFLCGVEGFGYRDPRRYPVVLLNMIVGNSFSSRLFQKIREEKGLCYSISSGSTSFSDTGEFVISFSTNLKNLPSVLEELDQELKLILEDGISEEELALVKDKFKGSYILAKESIEWKMMKMAVQELMLGEIISHEETIHKISGVKLGEVEEIVWELYGRRKFSFAAVGPWGQEKHLKDFQFSFSSAG
jgi:predicted Zn-dependent peptidase